MEQKFSIFIPLEIEKSGKTGEERYDNMKFKGIASNPNLGDDKQGQWLDPSGFDLNDFIKSGTFNWHHRWKDKPTAIVGQPTKAKITPRNELYVEGTLYKSSQVARDIYDLAEILERDSPDRRIGMSIEGIPTMVDPKNKNRILKAKLTNIALTPAPICPGTSMEIMKGGIDDLQFDDKEILVDITDNGVRYTVDNNLEITKSVVDDEIEKGGEGSRGGKIIGHTRSGKPIYFKEASSYKNFTKQDHLDAHKAHLKEAKNYKKLPTRAEGKRHEHDRISDDHLSYYDSLEKAIIAGSTTGTETTNQALTGEPLKPESIEDGRDKKEKKKAKIKNLISKGEVFTMLIKDHNLDASSCKRVWELTQEIEKASKGEGSRGGKVIGHTKSGIPIYEKPGDNHISRAISGYHHSEHTLNEIQSHIDHHQKMHDHYEKEIGAIRSKMSEAHKNNDEVTGQGLWDKLSGMRRKQHTHLNAVAAYKMAHAGSKILQDHQITTGPGLSDINDTMSMFSNVRTLLNQGQHYSKKAREEEE